MLFYIALSIILLIILIGGIDYYRQRNERKREPEQEPFEKEEPSGVLLQGGIGCCGRHDDCELAGKPHSFMPTIEYYDDEELDAFSGKTADSYTPEETALFREIVNTMQADDIEGWLFSLQQREITLPREIEAFLRPSGNA